MSPLLLSLKREIEARIREIEGAFAALVLADFAEGLRDADDEPSAVRYCRKWRCLYFGWAR